ncbi:MAG: hypothetical protein IJX93_05310 [Clostridia bacterium]|nr:hypothetical protein [Clostridia bacterium]
MISPYKRAARPKLEKSVAPSDNLQAVRLLRNALDAACFGEYRCQDWFTEITDTLAGLLNV